ncbi:MAG: hypothetical protein IPL33_21050 [Sphingobacteriales bacterium]|nr:hypothetical protein [Sphingobacteriales bacterium]
MQCPFATCVQDSDAGTLLLDEVTIAVTKFADNKLNVPNRVQVIGKREIAFQNTQTADLLSNAGAAFVQKRLNRWRKPYFAWF